MYLVKHQENVLSETSGKGSRADQDIWWWKKEVQDSVKAKKEPKKLWDSTRDEVTKKRYKRATKEVKQKVAKAKNDTYKELYQRLETNEGEIELFKIARGTDKVKTSIRQESSRMNMGKCW